MGDSIEYCEQCENRVGCHLARQCFHANDKAIGPLDAAACSLSPCPFCGSSPRVYEVVDTYQNMKPCGWVVRCLNPECPIRPHTVEVASRDVSVGWWNCRANSDSATAS
jgi:hypothetical protein